MKKGENHHEEQCVKIPDVIDECIHGIHIIPCYNKFTLILSREDEEKKKKRRTSDRHWTNPTSSSWVYPKECNICKKYKI